ncbi:MAG: acyl-CoA thioesterase, partial [Puniceicoccales bacterium]|nr:acyl-CoA thioesterase [Puniceicoccales bacterium]
METAPLYAGDDVSHYDYPIVVSEADIDYNKHANNVVYVRWVQEAATAHWETVIPPELKEGLSWVVMRHEIDYKKPAHLGDVLRVRTWVKSMTAIQSERHCLIFRDSDNQLLVKVRTLWCAINPVTAR